MTQFPLRALLAVATLAVVTGAFAREPASLYARLGGAPAVNGIATDLIDRAAKDPRTERSFRDSNLARVKEHLAAQLCDLAGGGCRYEGDPMREVHAGLEITDAEFYALVEILQDVMRERRIGLGERNAVVKLLAPMKRDVVRVAVPVSGAAQ